MQLQGKAIAVSITGRRLGDEREKVFNGGRDLLEGLDRSWMTMIFHDDDPCHAEVKVEHAIAIVVMGELNYGIEIIVPSRHNVGGKLLNQEKLTKTAHSYAQPKQDSIVLPLSVPVVIAYWEITRST